MQNLEARHAHDSDRIKEMLGADARHRRQAEEWQAMVDKTVVESELMKAHARGLDDLLGDARKDVAACKRQLEQKAADSHERDCRSRQLEAEIAALKADLRTAAHETRLLTHGADPDPDPRTLLKRTASAADAAYPTYPTNAEHAEAEATPHQTTQGAHQQQRHHHHHHHHTSPTASPQRHRPAPDPASPLRPGAAQTQAQAQAQAWPTGSWQTAVEVLEHDRQLTRHELSQIDREIGELQRSLQELSDTRTSTSAASNSNNMALPPLCFSASSRSLSLPRSVCLYPCFSQSPLSVSIFSLSFLCLLPFSLALSLCFSLRPSLSLDTVRSAEAR